MDQLTFNDDSPRIIGRHIPNNEWDDPTWDAIIADNGEVVAVWED